MDITLYICEFRLCVSAFFQQIYTLLDNIFPGVETMSFHTVDIAFLLSFLLYIFPRKIIMQFKIIKTQVLHLIQNDMKLSDNSCT